MGRCNVPEQCFVAWAGCILKDQFGFTATLSISAFGGNAEEFPGNFVALDLQHRGNAFGLRERL
jgi:hypothetical protein